MRRAAAVWLIAGWLMLVAVPAAAAPSSSAVLAAGNEYRFWSYWWGADGDWTYARAGAAHAVRDGDVEGWRYVQAPSGQASAPRAAPSFAAVCGHVPRPEGSARIALVVDYGTRDDAPPGEEPPLGVERQCVVVPEDQATGVAVLDGHRPLRQQDGLICAIGGYPQRECAPRVDPGAGVPGGRSAAWDVELPGVVGIGLVGLLGGVAAGRWRRTGAATSTAGAGRG